MAALERHVVVAVRDGLHARPATQFVQLAKRFTATLEVERGGQRANARSAVKLMLLGIKERDEILLRAEGEDAAEALDQLAAFIATPEAGQEAPPRAGAPIAAAAVPAHATPGAWQGIGASEGVAIGPAFAYFPAPLPEAPRLLPPGEIAGEVARHRAAVDSVLQELALRRAAARPGSEAAEILGALVELARDAELRDEMEGRIRRGLDAVAATLGAGRELAEGFATLDDPYLRARAEDLRSVARQIALTLLGQSDAALEDVPQGAILLAEELAAWDLARVPPGRLAGIVCRQGGATSHLAIMARAQGIPAVLACPAAPDLLQAAQRVALDGRAGLVQLDPDAASEAALSCRIAEERAARDALQRWRDAPSVTRDGRAIEIAANLGALAEIEAAQAAGAEGVGLFRSEFLFMARRTPPGEQEQFEVYDALARAFAPHSVVVRTLDIGGDKPVAGIDIPHEENPFLGWRGLRLCLERPDIFRPQLRALLRAAVRGNLRVMLPMVVEPEEVRQTRALIEQCRAELAAEGVPHGDFALGIMVETPAAALLADELAREVAFFSVGTNDLTQYVMAADRMNPRVARLNRPDHPAVLRAIGAVCRAARAAGIPVAVCGEAAARPELIPALVELGVTELSMSPASILRARQCVAGLGAPEGA
ncbi:phosphoenolpyruvate--protein phosphotransferase (plasmid) [Pseudoroseomonas cervicalis]|nr:phosphoenolpyruvate--protein phosphotransferase [Pseudoroseomonas cervicalis]WBV45442.1 phosphoenolpyruvate--protein phosphotransferase [Pseudoroseomonas cervicalis]